MNAANTSHSLGDDLALIAPPSFTIRPTAQGLAGSEASTGAALSLLLRPSAAGSLSADRLIESALALMQKKHPGGERLGATESIAIAGCSARTALMRASVAGSAPIHIVLSAVVVPDPGNSTQQRNLILLLEIPTIAFDKNREHYLRFAQQQLQIGPASPAQAPKFVLELAPMETAPDPEPAPAAVASQPAAVAAQSAPVRAIPEKPAAAQTISGKRPQPARTQARTAAAAATPEPGTAGDELLAAAAQGQRTLAISIALSFVARVIGNLPDVPIPLAYAIAAAVLIYAISGVLKICSGFGYSMNAKLALMFCSSVPLVAIACWVYLSIMTTRRLRAAGYQVGLFGVRA